MTVADVARAIDGELAGISLDDASRLLITGPPVADSRAAGPGSLFVADGNGRDFAGDAVVRGAIAALASEPLPGLPTVVAPDRSGLNPALPDRDVSVLALGKLARHVLGRLPDLTVIALTGSSGKTGTKDLLAHVLGGSAPTVAPDASLNDELGVPLTVLRADADTRFLVLEMGARARGHLTYLTGITRPSIGIVLNVGSAHAGSFGGREGIAEAKGELVEALPADGTAVLNADDDFVRAMVDRTKARPLLIGESTDAEVRATGIELDEKGRARFGLETPDGVTPVRLNLVGRHYVSNALAVAGVARCVGIDQETIAARLSSAERQARWRMEVTDRPDGVTVVNDGYNANPDSMRAALQAVRALAGGRRTWAVLGEMLELGPTGPAEHEAIGRSAVELGFDKVVAVGEGGRPIGVGAIQAGGSVDFAADQTAARALLDSELRGGDVVLVKSSRDAGLRYLGDALLGNPMLGREENSS